MAVLSYVEAAPVDLKMVSLQLKQSINDKERVGLDYTGKAHLLAIKAARRDGLLKNIKPK